MLHMAGIGILPYYLGNLIFSSVLLAIMYLPIFIFRTALYATSDWVLIDDDRDLCLQEHPDLCTINYLWHYLAVDLCTKLTFFLSMMSLIYLFTFLTREHPNIIFKYLFLMLYLLGYSVNVMLQYLISMGDVNGFFDQIGPAFIHILMVSPFVYQALNPVLLNYKYTFKRYEGGKVIDSKESLPGLLPESEFIYVGVHLVMGILLFLLVIHLEKRHWLSVIQGKDNKLDSHLSHINHTQPVIDIDSLQSTY